jgi:hypothetical protein
MPKGDKGNKNSGLGRSLEHHSSHHTWNLFPVLSMDKIPTPASVTLEKGILLTVTNRMLRIGTGKRINEPSDSIKCRELPD